MKAKSFWKSNLFFLLQIFILSIALFFLLLAFLILLRTLTTNRAANNRTSSNIIDSLINYILNSRFVQCYFGPWITRRNTSLNRSVSPQKMGVASCKKITVGKKVSFEANKQIVYSIHDPPSVSQRVKIE